MERKRNRSMDKERKNYTYLRERKTNRKKTDKEKYLIQIFRYESL